MKKYRILLLFIVLITALLVACGGGNENVSQESNGSDENPSNEDKPIVLKLAHSNNTKHKYQTSMLKMKELIEEKSDGRYTAEVFASTLGSDKDLLDALQMGTVDAAVVNTPELESFIPDIAVIDLPFIFKDREHAYRVLDGEIGDDFIEQIKQHDIVALTFWENGIKGITNNKHQIHTPEDVKGLKIRVMNSKVQLDTFKQFGANPTPMAFSEVFQSLQQGVLDGQFNAPDTVAANKLWEVQDYYSDIPLFYGALVFGFSPSTWNTFSDEDKEMFTKIAFEIRDFERELAKNEAAEGLEELKQNMDVNENPDVEAFVEAAKPVWDEFAKGFSEGLIDKISNY